MAGSYITERLLYQLCRIATEFIYCGETFEKYKTSLLKTLSIKR